MNQLILLLKMKILNEENNKYKNELEQINNEKEELKKYLQIKIK